MFNEVVERTAQLSDAELVQRLRELEADRRRVAAETAAVLAQLDERKVYRNDGHATMWGLLRATLHWSDAECKTRMQVARLVRRVPDAGDRLHETAASVANVAEIARAAANPRIGDQIEDEVGYFISQAERAEHDIVRLKVRSWETRTDRRAARQRTESRDEARDAHWRANDDGGELAVEWGPIDAIANREILDRYLEAEWLADWELTVDRYGDDAAVILMPRTDAQRRADAVTRALHDAASTPPGSKAPEPVVNVHVDHDTFQDILVEAEVLPERCSMPFSAGPAPVDASGCSAHDGGHDRDDGDEGAPLPRELAGDSTRLHESRRMCHTEHGDPVDPRTVFQLMIAGYLRYVILNDHGTPTSWGRKRRLFEGPARDAVRSLSTRCTHPGCRVRTKRTQTDHSIDYARGGRTDVDNGNPRCRRHNVLKNQGYTVHRDALGEWHTYRPDGTEIQ